MSEGFSTLGKSVARKDAVEKVKGEARFIPDIHLPKMLYARFLRSPYAHAKIKDMDTSEAEQVPGVKCILTHRNVPKVHPSRKFEFLLDETLHCAGEEVAAVAALTEEIAEEALGLIRVEYEVLPAVFDVDEAMKPDAVLVHSEYGTNIYHGTDLVQIPRVSEDGWLRLEVGDIEKGFAEADYVVDGVCESPMQYNCSPLPRGVVCEWTGDKLTCWADTQIPLFLWRDLSACLGVPQSSIRIISNYAVGGYGGKTPEKIAVLTAILAKRTGRPVRSVYTRAEDFISSHRRINYRNYNKVGVKKDGTLTAMYSDILANWGRDTMVPFICQSTAILDACCMLYRCPNAKAEGRGVLTNIIGYGAMNGFGDPEAIYGVEKVMDLAAEKIGMDPVEFRIKNCMRYGDRAMEYEQVLYGPIEWGIIGPELDGFPDIIRECADRAGWKEKWKGWRTPVAVDGPKRRGIGVAIGMHHTSFWPSSAIVKMNQDGTANVLSMAVEIGQGYATAIAQVVAETLGIRYEDVQSVLADTAATPTSIGNVASSGTSSPMNSARLAAEDVRRQLFELASPRLNAPVEALEARDGHICVKGTSKMIPIASLCFAHWQITGTAKNPPVDSIRDEKTGKVIHAYAAAVTVVEADVDTETGMVELVRLVSGHDCGRAINPAIIENQIDLGLIMSHGWVRTEKYVIDPKIGIMLNPNLLDYKLTTFLDMPESEDFETFAVEKPCAWGPFGAKGMSETSATAFAPALANAVYNAIGVRIEEGFLSHEAILRALAKGERR